MFWFCANLVYLLRYPLVCHFHLQQGGSHSGQLASLPSSAEPARSFCWIQGIYRWILISFAKICIIDMRFLRCLTLWSPSSSFVFRPTVKSLPRMPSSRHATIWSRTWVPSPVNSPRNMSYARWWDRLSSSRTAWTDSRWKQHRWSMLFSFFSLLRNCATGLRVFFQRRSYIPIF